MKAGLVIAGCDEFREFAGARHVRAFSDVRKIAVFKVNAGVFESAYGERATGRVIRNCTWLQALYSSADGSDMRRRGSATASNYVQQSGFSHFSYRLSHFFRSLVVTAHFVRQSGVRITAHREKAEPCHFIQERSQVVCSERAVQTECEKRIMAHRRVEGL